MQIESNLNLAFPVKVNDEGGPLVWAYNTPISKEVFRANWEIIAETNATIWGKGLKYAATAGARVANFTLLDISKANAEEHGTADTGPALLGEIKRLTLILAPDDAGTFKTLDVDAAIGRKIIDRDDWDEAEAAIVFFTVGFAMSRKAGRKTFCELISSRIAGSITSLPPMEFIRSLQISTPDATSEVPPLSLVAS